MRMFVVCDYILFYKSNESQYCTQKTIHILYSPTARTGDTLRMRAAATEMAGLICAPDTGRKMLVRVIMARPEVRPQYT